MKYVSPQAQTYFFRWLDFLWQFLNSDKFKQVKKNSNKLKKNSFNFSTHFSDVFEYVAL